MSLLTVAFALACAAPDALVDQPPAKYVTGSAFEAALTKPMSGSWVNIPLRQLLRAVQDSRETAILLDRRVDPARPVSADAAGRGLLDVLESIASRESLEVRVIGDVVVIGPPDGLAKLRTLAELRRQELSERVASLARPRQSLLTRGRTIHWNDLDTPAEIVRRITEAHQLKLEGVDRIPHDLWAGATLPDAQPHESLSIVLNQFDLTFEWTDRLEGIRVVPVPAEVTFERSYRPRGAAAAALSQWRDEIPDIDARVKGHEILVRGTAEQHDAFAALLQPRRAVKPPAVAEGVKPIKEQRFTLKVEDVPASAVIRKLEESGITFDYDPQALATDGVDLDMLISFDVKRATGEQFFRALCGPLGLSFEIDGSTVRLSPK